MVSLFARQRFFFGVIHFGFGFSEDLLFASQFAPIPSEIDTFSRSGVFSIKSLLPLVCLVLFSSVLILSRKGPAIGL